MTNFEKYRDKLMAISIEGHRVALVKQQPVDCHNISCTACDLYCEVPCDVERLKWLCAEYKEPAPKLTLEERSFCVVSHSGYIARDKNGILSIFCMLPERKAKVWESPDHVFKCIDSKYFSFITWENGPWSIPDLLKLEVEK